MKNRGNLYALGAYALWGLLPVYWKALHTVPALEILGHRVVWSFVFVLILILIKKESPQFQAAIASRRTILLYSLAAGLIGLNWSIYIWAVNAGFVVETSLGYFINPLVSVLLGVIFLREKLRPLQWVPVGLAGLGVLYLTVSYGQLPWIALALAFSFGFYGLVKKTAPLSSLHGLTLETAILLLPSGLYLLALEQQEVGSFGHSPLPVTLLLVITGVVTALPLLLFASAARRINLSTLGILQFFAPTIQLLLGVFLYGEPFTPARMVGFGLIWAALVVYTLEGVRQRRQVRSAAGTPIRDSALPSKKPLRSG